jgi:hypothetical protein
MRKKPFIKMLSADKVDWCKPKTREKSRGDEVIKRIIPTNKSQGNQTATESPKGDVKDQ